MEKLIKLVFLLFFVSPLVYADDALKFNPDTDFAQVEYVLLEETDVGYWKITVRVRHNDQGWDHYADYWKVTDLNTGKILGDRILLHPHDNEQPFSRSASGIFIEKNIRYIKISAKCSLHGYEGRSVIVDLEKDADEFYRIKK